MEEESIESSDVPEISAARWRERFSAPWPRPGDLGARSAVSPEPDRWRYSPAPVPLPTGPIVLDGRGQFAHRADGGHSWSALRNAVDQAIGAKATILAKASFRHRLDPSERKAFDRAIVSGEVITSPAGSNDDHFVAQIAGRESVTLIQSPEQKPPAGVRVLRAAGTPGDWVQVDFSDRPQISIRDGRSPALDLLVQASKAARLSIDQMAQVAGLEPREVAPIVEHHVVPAIDDLLRAYDRTGHGVQLKLCKMRGQRLSEPAGLTGHLPKATISEHSKSVMAILDMLANAAGHRIQVEFAWPA